ncbi:hypothetical protein PCC7418_2149 [Halothece sp. PCC 7418]|uniref:DUF1517 domain-containing protein n=1 Tax=Halothece sp. (strain PCC 7418) TaxID=65093 RepID=UPI0002A0641B|nr:DUF1517 domain-containing protein [Halothece sp. PCC 7418]AFZ44309.1 hypothetical protein PCC7418_2149 [Halothece sp. PCC 7418]
MFQNISWKRFLKSFFLVALAFIFVFSDVSGALAARSGGRIGGGGFRAPSRSAPAPRGGNRPGGGFGFPFLLPFFGFGGFGSIFTILIFFAIANFLVRSFQNAGFGGGDGVATANPKVTVSKVQVGLLADAKELQKELNDLAQRADTGTAAGRSMVLQEATLTLLRHPEYWVYAKTESNVSQMDAAESQFNRFALSERSKYSEETLSNVEGLSRQETSEAGNGEAPAEYIVVTILAGIQGKVDLPKTNSADDVRQALRQLGSTGSENLLAVEVIWTPQAEDDTLSNDDLLAAYPDLNRL